MWWIEFFLERIQKGIQKMAKLISRQSCTAKKQCLIDFKYAVTCPISRAHWTTARHLLNSYLSIDDFEAFAIIVIEFRELINAWSQQIQIEYFL